MEDEQIIGLFFDRREEALAATEEKYGHYCFCIARNILENPEDAREAVNDAYLGAWNAIPPQEPRNLGAFLGKITRRIAINKWLSGRAAKRGGGETPLALEELSACIPGGTTPEQELDARELSRLLNAFIRSLPESERRVFVRRYWYLDSVKDIAADFGFSQSKVKSMLFRTRNRLRSQLEKEDIYL